LFIAVLLLLAGGGSPVIRLISGDGSGKLPLMAWVLSQHFCDSLALKNPGVVVIRTTSGEIWGNDHASRAHQRTDHRRYRRNLLLPD
jgi:hypothetical protein